MPEATHSPREVRGNSSGRLAAVPGRHRDASPPNNLPLQLSSFVGRLLKESRLLTLTQDWREARERYFRANVVRGLGSAVAFVCFVIAAIMV